MMYVIRIKINVINMLVDYWGRYVQRSGRWSPGPNRAEVCSLGHRLSLLVRTDPDSEALSNGHRPKRTDRPRSLSP